MDQNHDPFESFINAMSLNDDQPVPPEVRFSPDDPITCETVHTKVCLALEYLADADTPEHPLDLQIEACLVVELMKIIEDEIQTDDEDGHQKLMALLRFTMAVSRQVRQAITGS